MYDEVLPLVDLPCNSQNDEKHKDQNLSSFSPRKSLTANSLPSDGAVTHDILHVTFTDVDIIPVANKYLFL